MKSILIRFSLVYLCLLLCFTISSHAATERRIALVIGNGAYGSGPLKNPVNDAADMATALQRAGFSVMLKKNANLQEMVETIEEFGNKLKRGGVGLFYFAGHGVQVNSVNYLIPVNARINKESDVRFQAVDAGRVLAEMEYANNGLNIVILDACRDNPFGKSFRSAARGLAIVSNAPTGTFISYSTGAGQVARDGTGRNSPYTRALLENIAKPGLTIHKVFMNVRSKVKKETGQVPWELSSLEGDFFFVPSQEKFSADDLDDENAKIEAERRRLEQERAVLAKKKALDEKRRKLEEEKERLAKDLEEQRRAETERKRVKESKNLAISKRPAAPPDGSPVPMPARTASPSFDCRKATTAAERLICSNNELAQADVQLAQAYKTALANSSNKAALKREQIAWLKKKRDVCVDANTMLTVIKERIEQLSR